MKAPAPVIVQLLEESSMACRALLLLALLLPAASARATCMPHRPSGVVSADCRPLAAVPPGGAFVFAGEGACCWAGPLNGGCRANSVLGGAEAKLALQLLAPGARRARPVEVRLKRATGSCEGLPLYGIEGPLAPGSYAGVPVSFLVEEPPVAPAGSWTTEPIDVAEFAAVLGGDGVAVAAVGVTPQVARGIWFARLGAGPVAPLRFLWGCPSRELEPVRLVAEQGGGFLVAGCGKAARLAPDGAPVGEPVPLAGHPVALASDAEAGLAALVEAGGAYELLELSSALAVRRRITIGTVPAGGLPAGALFRRGDRWLVAARTGAGSFTLGVVAARGGTLQTRREVPFAAERWLLVGEELWALGQKLLLTLDAGGIPRGAPVALDPQLALLDAAPRDATHAWALGGPEARPILASVDGGGGRGIAPRLAGLPQATRWPRLLVGGDALFVVGSSGSNLSAVRYAGASIRTGAPPVEAAPPAPPEPGPALREHLYCVKGPGSEACSAPGLGPVASFAVAAREEELAVVAVRKAEPGAAAALVGARLDRSLRRLGAKLLPRGSTALAVALAPHEDGFLLAVESWSGVELRGLDAELTEREPARELPGATSPSLVSVAGKPPLLLFRAADGRWSSLSPAPGAKASLLGAPEGLTSIEQHHVSGKTWLVGSARDGLWVAELRERAPEWRRVAAPTGLLVGVISLDGKSFLLTSKGAPASPLQLVELAGKHRTREWSELQKLLPYLGQRALPGPLVLRSVSTAGHTLLYSDHGVAELKGKELEPRWLLPAVFVPVGAQLVPWHGAFIVGVVSPLPDGDVVLHRWVPPAG